MSQSHQPVRLSAWQDLLCRYADLFGKLDADARLGFVAAREESMIVCHREQGGWLASVQRFTGVGEAPVHLLLVLDAATMAKAAAADREDLLPLLRRQVRLGNIVCFRKAAHEELMAHGFADLMDAFGMDEMARAH